MQSKINKDALKIVMAHVAEFSTPQKPVQLVVATKYASVAQMFALYEAGVRHFGENKIQDALVKKKAFEEIIPPARGNDDVTWHFIGHLQQNKVNKTFSEAGRGEFALIHSVDSIALAERLSEANLSRGLCQPILLQINQTEEPQKSGLLPDALHHDVAHVLTLKGVQVHGFMAFGHPSLVPESCAAVFSAVSEHAKCLSALLGHEFSVLSMGMSQDYLPALQKGATIIRVGRQLFIDE